jgi:hypothetical protein
MKRAAVEADPLGFARKQRALVAIHGKHGELQTR